MVANLHVEEWHAVHQRLRSIARRRAELDAEQARCLRDAERIQLWRQLGYVHMGEYLERELGYGPHAGAERMRVARALGELPQIEAALDAGELHYSAVRELSRLATGETEAEWLATARGKNLRQVEAAVAGRKRGDRPGDPTSPELVNRIVRLELSPDAFALWRQTAAALADEHGGRLDDSAFIQALCRSALEGAGPVEHARPAHQISITVCETCKRGWQNGAGREIEVGPDVIERAQCDAEHIGSLEAAQPARVTATVTPRLRRQVLARDHHRCTVPGCRSARNLDLHHIRYQSEGGSHEIGNMTTLCAGHHQRLHEGALMIRGRAPDGLEFTWRAPAAAASGQGQSHGGPPEGSHARDIAVPVERAQSHRGRGGRHRPAAATSLARDTTGAALAQRLPSMGAFPNDQETAVSRRGHQSSDASSVDDEVVVRDARDALTTAGYKPHEARRAVDEARSRVGPGATLEQLLREALRRCVRSVER